MERIFESVEVSTLVISALAGVLIGIPTGPGRFLVIDTCLNDGKMAALKVYGGFFSALLLYGGLGLAANNIISSNETVEALFYLVASVLMAGWGVIIIAKSKKGQNSSIDLNIQSWFKKGFIVGISNPVIPFVYLALLQLIKAYSKERTMIVFVTGILTFEIFSFLTISVIALVLFSQKKNVLKYWYLVKIAMGVLLVCLGSYHTYQQIDFSDGIGIKPQQNILEEQIDKKAEEQQELL